MKDLSVSNFKATIAACLREVQNGETLIITEHKRPVAEVRAYKSKEDIIIPASREFSLVDTAPANPDRGLWQSLLDEERGDR